VHLSHIGYPIVGDDLYGGKHSSEADFGGTDTTPFLCRQALHAAMLGFRHPITNEPMQFLAPIAPDIHRAVRLLRTHRFRRSLSAPGTVVPRPAE
jgi:23S rRNA pseudouridine1911/1915/1917 synthase